VEISLLIHRYYVHTLPQAVEISGESWQLVMIKVMVWYFVRDTCKVMIALILVVFVLVFLELAQWLTSKCYFL
jgi:hypothetical protein